MRFAAWEVGVTAKVAPAFAGSLFRFKVMLTKLPAPTWTVAVVAVDAVTPFPPTLKEIVIAGTVMGAVPDLEPSATETALTVTVKSLAGGVVGAV